MPIAFRCQHCQQLMSISRRKAGTLTTCPRCEQETLVPTLETAAQEVPEPVLPPPAESPPPHRPISLAPPGPETDSEPLTEFRLRPRRSDEEEMDLTPMVDVTFLLLIFFMVTASFSIQKSLAVPPPDPDQQGASQTVVPLEELQSQAILIEIDADNRIFVETQPVDDLSQLPTVLAEVRSRERKDEVIITVQEQTRHETMVQAIDAAQEVGMQRIRWAVQSLD